MKSSINNIKSNSPEYMLRMYPKLPETSDHNFAYAKVKKSNFIFKADFQSGFYSAIKIFVKLIWVENLEIPAVQPKYNKHIFVMYLQSFIKTIVMRLKLSFLRQVSGFKLNYLIRSHLIC